MACGFARERGQRNRCNSRIEVDFEKSSVNAHDHDERKDDHDETANERDCPYRDALKECQSINGIRNLRWQRNSRNRAKTGCVH